jgi:hypothetical protein
VIICHRTGSDSNPYVVINIPWTAWSEAHSPDTGSHPTLNGRDDIMLQDPASGPGAKDGFTKEDCESGGEAGGSTTGGTTGGTAGGTTGGTGGAATTGGGGAGAGGGGGAGAGGALGSGGSAAGQGALPFTGLSILLALLVSGSLIAGGAALRRRGHSES